MKKKLSLALALSLAACGSRTNSPNTPPAVTSPDTPSASSAAAPEQSTVTGPVGDSSKSPERASGMV